MKTLILLISILALTSCASIFSYNYSLGFRNTGTNVVRCYSVSNSSGSTFAPGILVPNATKIMAGPFQHSYHEKFQLIWETRDQHFTNTIDLTKLSVPSGSDIILTIDISNRLGVITAKP